RICAGSGTYTCLILKLTQRFRTFTTFGGELVLCHDEDVAWGACVFQRKLAVAMLGVRVAKKAWSSAFSETLFRFSASSFRKGLFGKARQGRLRNMVAGTAGKGAFLPLQGSADNT